MKLHATPLSHFSRKVRILLDLYAVPYELIDIGNVADRQAEIFANNPLLKVPVLVDGDSWLIESDHIADYVVHKFDPADKYQVRTRNITDLNIRAVLNGIMSEEVKLILARRTGVPVEQYSVYDKARAAVANGLHWLALHATHFTPECPTYREWHLVCCWDHLAYYELVPLNYVELQRIVDSVSQHPTVRKTNPFVLKPKIEQKLS